MRESSHLLEAKHRIREFLFLLLLLQRMEDFTEPPAGSSSCLVATHDRVTLACGLKESVRGVQSHAVTEPALFFCFAYSPVFKLARQIEDKFCSADCDSR